MEHYIAISKLFDYPDDSYLENLNRALKALLYRYPSAYMELEEFKKLLPTETYKLQELYTKSFEVQAVTSLEVGYVLYGDDYTRGGILSNLTAEHRAVGNDCGGELPDHLANLLRLLPKLKDRDLLDDLVKLLIAPAVENMMQEYSPSSMIQKDRLYRKQYKTLIVPPVPLGIFLHLFKALYILLDSDFELIKENRPFEGTSFFGFLKSELEVEEGKKSSNSCSATFNSCGTPITACGI